ncbi:cell wall protein [Streptomyces sp. NPDC091272]|uniref:cell wall protein n=1 Tax=Streptomyces sp. NPDC091272 TaxID=3365981 RepID=UPI0037F67555
MAALRPLLTATAAGGLLAALWFVPSANATVEAPERTGRTTGGAQAQQVSGTADTTGPDTTGLARTTQVSDPAEAAAGSPDASLALADTGSVDTTPYVIGGTAFLGIGAGFVTYSVRRKGADGPAPA